MRPMVQQVIAAISRGAAPLEWDFQGWGLTDSEVTTIITTLNTVPELKAAITSIDLSHNQLQSMPNFGHMPNLQALDLKFNRISHISDQLAGLPNLRTLDLQDNRISTIDSIPCGLLETLNLANNHIISLPPLPDLAHLRQLHLAENRLHAFPIIHGAELEFINVAGNQIDPESVLSFAQLLRQNNPAITLLVEPPNQADVQAIVDGPSLEQYLQRIQQNMYTNFQQTNLTPEKIAALSDFLASNHHFFQTFPNMLVEIEQSLPREFSTIAEYTFQNLLWLLTVTNRVQGPLAAQLPDYIQYYTQNTQEYFHQYWQETWGNVCQTAEGIRHHQAQQQGARAPGGVHYAFNAQRGRAQHPRSDAQMTQSFNQMSMRPG